MPFKNNLKRLYLRSLERPVVQWDLIEAYKWMKCLRKGVNVSCSGKRKEGLVAMGLGSKISDSAKTGRN